MTFFIDDVLIFLEENWWEIFFFSVFVLGDSEEKSGREGGCSMPANPFIALNSDYNMVTYFHGTWFLQFLVQSLKDSAAQSHTADTKGVSLGPAIEIRGHFICCEDPA